MDLLKTTPILLQNNYFTSNNKPVKFFQVQKMQNKLNQSTLPNLAPTYFHPSFSANPNKMGLNLSELVKQKFYAKKGIRYLLPQDVWSDKKIFDTIDLLNEDINMLLESKMLNKESLQGTVNKFIPEAKGKIIIKDWQDFENDLIYSNVPENRRNIYLSYKAFTAARKKDVKVYFDFKNALTCKEESIAIKCDIKHELTHCLTSRFQNTKTLDSFKNNKKNNSEQDKIVNEIFCLFEKQYNPGLTVNQMETTQENMLKQLGFSSLRDLHKNFEKIINFFIEDKKMMGELDLELDRKSKKQFFNIMKHNAEDEKKAYQSTKVLREIFDDSKTPTNAELLPMLYDEMAKFFTKKAHNC